MSLLPASHPRSLPYSPSYTCSRHQWELATPVRGSPLPSRPYLHWIPHSPTQQKCDEQMTAEGGCQTCASLHLQCLRGFGPKRLDWLRVPIHSTILSCLFTHSSSSFQGESCCNRYQREVQVLPCLTGHGQRPLRLLPSHIRAGTSNLGPLH